MPKKIKESKRKDSEVNSELNDKDCSSVTQSNKNVKSQNPVNDQGKTAKKTQNVKSKQLQGMSNPAEASYSRRRESASRDNSNVNIIYEKSSKYPGARLPSNKMEQNEGISESLPPSNILKELEEDGIFPLKKKSARFARARFICRLCEYHCDSVLICLRHISNVRHIQQREVKMMEGMLKSFPGVSKCQVNVITNKIKQVYEWQYLTADEMEMRKNVKQELQQTLQNVVPNCSLQISGSSLSGFALKTSDLNIDVIVTEDTKPATALIAVLKIISDSPSYCEVENQLSSSYPCLCFTHKQTMIHVEVGVSSPHAFRTNTLLSHYSTLDSRVTPLIIAFRLWAKLSHIDQQNKGTLPGHCFPIMALHFLQQSSPPVIPSLHALKAGGVKNKLSDKYIEPNEIKPPWKSLNVDSLGKLWIDLFKFYSVDYKMAQFVVNIRYLEPLLRKDCMWGKKMAIEDPFQTKRNLTRSVSNSSVFDYIVLCIKFTYRYFITPQMYFGPLFKKVLSKENDEMNVDEKFPQNISTKFRTESEAESDHEIDHENVEETNDDDISQENQKNDNGPTEIFVFEKSKYVEDITEVGSHDSISLPDVSHSLRVVPWHTAVALMKQLQPDDAHYSFLSLCFTDGKKPPVYCASCLKMGHDKYNCQEYDLPRLKPLGTISTRYYDILSCIFFDLKKDCAPTSEEILARETIVNDLQDYIRHSFDGAILKLFGSSANGFGFSHSDLDICLMFEGHPTGESFDHIKLIEKLAEKLKKFRECRQVLAITTAKVPIVKFVVKKADLDADLSLYNTLALENTKLLNAYSQIDARVQILGYAMKYFAKLCDMGDASRGSLSSYAYTLMVLHFLQQSDPPVIPVLQKLYPPDKPPPENLIDNWNVWFFNDLESLPKVWSGYNKNKQGPGELWMKLLRYYTEIFNWKDHVITISQLKPLTRLEKLWTTQCIAIEDPFDLSHNLGAGLSRKMNMFIMKAFIRGREVFGAGKEVPPFGLGYTNLVTFLFDKRRLTDGAPPNDRGCRYCGRIGHLVRDCPRKKPEERNEDPGKNMDDDRNGKHRGPTARDKVLQKLPKGTEMIDLLPNHSLILELFFNSVERREELIHLGYRFYPSKLFNPRTIVTENSGMVALKVPCPKKKRPFFALFLAYQDPLKTKAYRDSLKKKVLPPLGVFLNNVKDVSSKLKHLSVDQVVAIDPNPLMEKLNSTPSRVIGPAVPPPPHK